MLIYRPYADVMEYIQMLKDLMCGIQQLSDINEKDVYWSAVGMESPAYWTNDESKRAEILTCYFHVHYKTDQNCSYWRLDGRSENSYWNTNLASTDFGEGLSLADYLW